MRIKFEAHFVFVSINAFRFSQPSRFVLRDLKELLDNVPALFSTAEAIQAGKEVGLSERSVMYMLVNLTTSKVIRKIKRGEYEKLQ